MKSHFLNYFVLLVFITGLFVVQPTVQAHAATVWTVNSIADGVANPANCPGAGCRLRDAITAASNGDTIVFGASVTGTITLNSGELSITNLSITIMGPGAAQLTIDGNNNGRILGIYGGPTVSISGLTLTHGLANYILYPPGSDYPAGGAILNSFDGHLTLDQMVIDHNTVDCGGTCTNNGIDGTGGGIASSTSSSLIITNSSITNNIAPSFGGGAFFNSGTVAGDDVTLANVTIANNQVTDPAIGDGGGLELAYTNLANLTNLIVSSNTAGNAGGGLFSSVAPNITLTNSTFSSNQALGTGFEAGGGGIYVAGSAGLLMGNSTFADNSSTVEGGALLDNGTSVIIYNSTFTGNSEAALGSSSGGGALDNVSGTLQLANDTLSGNTASSTHGGALFNHFGTVYLQNTILANSIGSDCASNTPWVSNVNNLMVVNDGINPCSSVGLSSDPMLGPLAGNGGPTQTMALLAGSPAIDAGSNSVCSGAFTVNNKDQRGVIRPIDGDNNGSAICDIGAYEFVPNANVNVIIAGLTQASYSIPPGGSKRDNYQGVNNGPVKVTGSNNTVPIIAAERDAWAANGVTTSFAQLMGLPAGQLSDTYVFPAYNNVTLNEQLRIGNVDTSPTTVTVTIGGNVMGTYPLAANESVRENYAGLDSGPVIVQANPSVHIIAAIRDAWAAGAPYNTTTSFVQLMGLPASQLSDTYVFPAYNNVTLNEQLRIGNVDSSPTTVTVTIGGVVRGTYPLAANASVRENYAGLDSGPVIVQASPSVHIIAAIRDAWGANGVTTSFTQLMGLPAGGLSDTYLFPAYNNVTLNEQLRIGNVDTSPTTVTVTVGGVVQGTYPLAASQSVRVNYAGLNSGPVRVQASPSVHIIAAMRDAWAANGVTTSFIQLMGLPAGSLSNTYLFPAYNDVTLDEQLRIGVP